MHYRQSCARLQTMNDSWTLEPNRVILSHPPNTANINSTSEIPNTKEWGIIIKNKIWGDKVKIAN